MPTTYFICYTGFSHSRLADFGYTGAEKWQRAYGVIEEIQKLEDEDHTYGRIKRRNIVIKKRPGVSPEVIGKFFLDKSAFIRLADVIDGLPPYDEIVVGVNMDPLQKKAYRELESDLRAAVKSYKMKATGSMLQALLCYPDSCVVFPEHIEIKDKEAQVLTTIYGPQARHQPPPEGEGTSCHSQRREGPRAESPSVPHVYW